MILVRVEPQGQNMYNAHGNPARTFWFGNFLRKRLLERPRKERNKKIISHILLGLQEYHGVQKSHHKFLSRSVQFGLQNVLLKKQ